MKGKPAGFVRIVLAIAFVVCGSWGFLRPSHAQTPRESTGGRRLNADERANVQLFRNSAPSVVNIDTKRIVRSNELTLNLEEIRSGTGSGFLWDRDGHVVTNFHVIRGASGARVTLSDGSAYEAQLVGTAPEFDIAVLRIQAESDELQPLAVGRSDDLLVGQQVYAIGNPFGSGHLDCSTCPVRAYRS